ncbi:WD40 repeat [Macleaya cordata]|uniref:WD40 repeat n=1 Tax=Macleaya cordata TaxID=56857 RepID=A0A200R7D2_MACCD|nr:WD40 repeat [Macleaya cordata]
MEIDFGEYRLSSELRGHEDDVRGICVCGDTGIATSSRDRTVRFWSLDPAQKNKCTSSKIMLGHTSFVGPLAWISPDESFPEGQIVSGGMDTLVLLWDLKKGESVQTMKGHQLQVTGLAIDDNADIISASVDCTLRRWRNGQPIESWEAHKAAIQAVIKLPSGELITGAISNIMMCSQSHVNILIANLFTISLWMIPIYVLLSFAYFLFGIFIRNLFPIWKKNTYLIKNKEILLVLQIQLLFLIKQAAQTTMHYLFYNIVCLFLIKQAAQTTKHCLFYNIVCFLFYFNNRNYFFNYRKSYDCVLKPCTTFFKTLKRVGGLKLEELPGVEALHIPGTADGQTKVVREGDNGVAYSWNSRDQKWDKIGEVVDGPEDSMKRPVLDGVQYDYVFDVDIGDGEPIRKLPYNRSDNPYDAADKWLLKENLPLSYRQQIVEFILQNSGQKEFAFDTSFRDPYTGGVTFELTFFFSTYISRISGVPTKPVFMHIPKKGMLFFDVAQFDGILKKIAEFNNALLLDPVQKDLSLTEIEMSRIAAVLKILRDTSHYHSSTFADVDIALMLKLLKSWPDAMVFPVIDVLRMIILHPDGARLLLQHVKEGNDMLMETIKKVTTAPALAANLLTSTRAVTNLFKHLSFHPWLQGHRSEILDVFSSCCSSSNKNVQLSYSTLVLNYAVLLIEKKDQEGQSQVLSAALEIAEEGNVDVDSKFRALVAVGSLMLEGLVKGIAMDFDVQSIAKVAKASKEVKIAEVGADIELVTKQT